jgi:hypothetical protein
MKNYFDKQTVLVLTMQRYEGLPKHANLFNEPAGFFNEMAPRLVYPGAISLL